LKTVKDSRELAGSRSPPESSGLAFDNAAVAFTASGQSIINVNGAANAEPTTMPEVVGGKAALGDEPCTELGREVCAELFAALSDELSRELWAALSEGFATSVALELMRPFAMGWLLRLEQQSCPCIDAHESAATTMLAVLSGVSLVAGASAADAASTMLSQPSMQPPPAIQKATAKASVTRTILIEERNLILPRSLAIWSSGCRVGIYGGVRQTSVCRSASMPLGRKNTRQVRGYRTIANVTFL
jgi:hypothetical protein